MSNPNTVYANIFVEELIRSGLKHVCFVPGSRHTPLILAFAKYKETINIYSHLDERSASFFALGLALALDEPVAMVCTSGTAGANFFPAIIEAHQSRVPLIVLTADRPHELRQSGANQTIDQIKMFGDFVLWFYDAPLPEANPPAVALRNLQNIAKRAIIKAFGLRKGVVHINLPFRKPLESENNGQIGDNSDINNLKRSARFWKSYTRETTFALNYLPYKEILTGNGIIYIGHGALRKHNDPNNSATFFAELLSANTGYPIFAEFTSNMRQISSLEYAGEKHGINTYQPFGAYENYLGSDVIDFSSIDVVIRLGAPPISKNMQTLLSSAQLKYHIYGGESEEWADDTHTVTDYIVLEPFRVLTHLIVGEWGQIKLDKKSDLREKLTIVEKNTWQIIDHEIETGAYFDGAVVYDVVDLIPDESTLFAGNSLPVRHLDQFGKPTNKRIYAYANRGASGIDGNISTALGAGAARPDKPLVAILGDITFYHDMNGLLAVHRCGVPITIVLLNNNGGGIFHRLPISQFDPDFTDYFVTAHGLDYSHSAKLYSLEYIRADNRSEFRQAFTESITNRTSTIIEVRTDAQEDLKRRNEIVSAVHAQLKELDL